MFEKYKKPCQIHFRGATFFKCYEKWQRKNICNQGGLIDAKYGLINGKLYQMIIVINLNKIKNWNEIKKSSRGVNGNFQAQGNNNGAKHFSYNFITKNTGDVFNFMLKLIDNENKEIKFEEKEKKISNH